MRIKKIQTYALKIPMKIKHAQHNKTTATSESVIIKVTTENGIIGYGECCPRSYVTGESVVSVINDLQRHKAMIEKLEFQDLAAIEKLICNECACKIGLAAICGVELALLDAFSKEQQQSLISIFGGQYRAKFDYTGIVPLQSVNSLVQFLPRLQHFDFKHLKMKVDRNLDSTITKLGILQAAFPKATIRLDINEAWTLEIAKKQIPKLLALGVNTFEQPFPKQKEKVFQQLTAAFGKESKIMIDESITTYASAWFLIHYKVCNHFNLKISKHGGIFKTLKIYDLITRNGLTCQLGAHYGETCILTASQLLVASLCPEITLQEGAFGTNLLTTDIGKQPLQIDRDGQIKTASLKLTENGLGMSVEEPTLHKYSALEQIGV